MSFLLRKLRKSDAFKAFLFRAFRLLPIKKHKIVFSNFSGKRCGDSPRSISDVLVQKHPEWDIVWLSHPKYNPPIPEGTRKVTFGMNSLKMIYELATAKVWVDSHTKFAFTKKRRGQFYMETWHGGLCLKKIEGDAAASLDEEYLKRVKVNSKLADVFLSDGKWCTELYRRAFWYNGDILEYGLPRNDALVLDKALKPSCVHKNFNLPADAKIALYAPTFRVDGRTDCYKLPAEDLIKKLEQKFGGNWYLLVRLHPVAMQGECPIVFTDKILNATPYPDMQELLKESDIAISDYSSCLFDFALQNRPCFLYALDVEDYKKDRDLYFDLKTLPFPLAENGQQLLDNIDNYTDENYEQNLQKFFSSVGLVESGNATAKAVERIENWVNS